MKYEIGNNLFFRFGLYIYPCSVIKKIENTNRYRIKFNSSWSYLEKYALVGEKQLFLSKSELLDSEIEEKKIKISEMQIELYALRNELQNIKKVEVNEVKNEN